MRILPGASSALVLLVVASSCVSAEVEAEERSLFGGYQCPNWRCGFNAAEVNGHSITALNLDGIADASGLRLVGFVPPPLRLGYTLDVDGDALIARKGSKTLTGAQMIGAILLVQLPGGLVVPVTLAGHAEVPSWAEDTPPIAAYTLLYPEPQELLGVKNVCTGSLLDPLISATTILGGERYDEATKEVLADQPRWFTIACAGAATAKMKLLGYGPQSSATTPAQRQATLKMITADYCGDGESYTENGTAVLWSNESGSVSPPGDAVIGEVEAVWTEAGALCLDATRIADAEVGCALPSCDGFGLEDGEWVTHLPGG